MAREFDAKLQLVHITQSRASQQGNPRYESEMREGNARKMEEILASPSLENVTVEPLIEQGDPGTIIAQIAARENSDVIVIATHGWTGWRNRVLGSVAEKVLRVAPCPVLASRAPSPQTSALKVPPRKILCATDWSEPSLDALEVAGQWARHFGAQLCVLHVVKPLESPGMLLSSHQIEKTVRAEASERLRQITRERLPETTDVRTLIHTGNVAETIVAVADEEDADLLVLATQGADGWRASLAGTPLDEMLFGSVTNKVLQLSLRPVLTVRLPSPDSTQKV